MASPREGGHVIRSACAGCGNANSKLTWLTGLEHLPIPNSPVTWLEQTPWVLLVINSVGVSLANCIWRGPRGEPDSVTPTRDPANERSFPYRPQTWYPSPARRITISVIPRSPRRMVHTALDRPSRSSHACQPCVNESIELSRTFLVEPVPASFPRHDLGRSPVNIADSICARAGSA